MTAAPDELVVTRPASIDLSDRLPESVASAAIELITGSLIDAPRRIGAALRDEYDGLWSARLGTYRVIYRIDDANRQVEVVRVLHRRDAYRPRSS
ncbi:type II toxin-antitoxin system RelE family toxin [Candidatus Poriferisodalis sp.]|uniref:type II toxin-antitoxin system RelE family toxin n=1 Tax=Candidatus Poriferisodalis sp. TaxID=3101277 RepID=UPI003B025E6B